MNSSSYFATHGCVLVKNFIDEQTVAVVSKYFENKIRRGEWKESAADVEDPTSRFAYYADPLIEVLLQASTEAVEKVTGMELIPTYSYSRVYQPGEALRPHVDRDTCEISVTVNVASKGEVSPIYTQYGQNEPEKHVLSPGDAVVYMGCDAVHWRQPLKEGQLNVQFMLHYVDKNGQHTSHAKDKRPDYGYGLETRSQ